MTCKRCDAIDSPCRGVFGWQGIHTVHWECWSECNLQCDFCYRSLRSPLDTSAAVELVDALSFGGVARLILAGGDPSLRRDLAQICRHAVEQELTIEVQTNSQTHTPALLASLPFINRLYVSLDGATAATHDAFRSKRGNFVGVNKLLKIAEARGLPVTVHSVASGRNWQELPDLLGHIQRYSCVDTWSVLEFSAIGAGYQSRCKHQLAPDEWHEVVTRLRSAAVSRPRLALLGVHEKKALYAMVSADGYAYRAAEMAESPIPDNGRIGSILDTHLCDIATAWRIDRSRHQQRYVGGLDSVAHDDLRSHG